MFARIAMQLLAGCFRSKKIDFDVLVMFVCKLLSKMFLLNTEFYAGNL
jgi:hypothetical protein